jgi:O-antigen/teichoic acid export membrane protein
MPVYFGNSLLVAVATSLLLSLLAPAAIAPLIGAASSFALMAVLCVSELLFAKLIDICGQVFIAREKLRLTSRFVVLQSAARLAAIPAFMSFAAPSALNWACGALATNLLVAAYVLYATLKETGMPLFDTGLALRETRQGVHFAIGLSAKGFYTDADKAFLARFESTEIVGLYTSAFRVVQMALTPVRAVAQSSLATFFREGERGLQHSLQVAARLAAPLGVFSVAIAIGFFVMAPLLPVLLGPGFAGSVEVVRWLSLLPLVFAAQSLLSDALSGAGYQSVRAAIQIGAAVAACVLNIALIRPFGWKGAVFASYGSQLLMVLGLLAAIVVLGRRAGRR